jgi:hypothetical protein
MRIFRFLLLSLKQIWHFESLTTTAMGFESQILNNNGRVLECSMSNTCKGFLCGHESSAWRHDRAGPIAIGGALLHKAKLKLGNNNGLPVQSNFEIMMMNPSYSPHIYNIHTGIR